jgi:hypothetical protein
VTRPLFEGMTAGEARASGVQVPREVPDAATLRHRGQRIAPQARPLVEGIESIPDVVALVDLWVWDWRQSLHVGPRGVPDERGVDVPCEGCGALEGHCGDSWRRCKRCGYPGQ